MVDPGTQLGELTKAFDTVHEHAGIDHPGNKRCVIDHGDDRPPRDVFDITSIKGPARLTDYDESVQIDVCVVTQRSEALVVGSSQHPNPEAPSGLLGADRSLVLERDLVEVRLHRSGVEHMGELAFGGELQVVRKWDR